MSVIQDGFKYIFSRQFDRKDESVQSNDKKALVNWPQRIWDSVFEYLDREDIAVLSRASRTFRFLVHKSPQATEKLKKYFQRQVEKALHAYTFCVDNHEKSPIPEEVRNGFEAVSEKITILCFKQRNFYSYTVHPCIEEWGGCMINMGSPWLRNTMLQFSRTSDLYHIASFFPNIRKIVFDTLAVTDIALYAIRTLEHLNELHLNKSVIVGASDEQNALALSTVLTGKKIERLTLPSNMQCFLHNDVTLPFLKMLSFNQQKKLEARRSFYLKADIPYEDLRNDVQGMFITDAALQSIVKMNELQELSVSLNQHVNLSSLASLEQLHHLGVFYEGKMQGETINAIGRLPLLTSLSITAKIGITDIKGLSSLQNLEHLTICLPINAVSQFGGVYLEPLAALKNLYSLVLSGAFSPEAMLALSTIKQLKLLTLRGAFEKDTTSTFPNFSHLEEFVHIDWISQEMGGLHYIAGMKNLKRLAFGGAIEHSILHLLPQRNSCLEELILTTARPFTSADFTSLSQLQSLVKLHIDTRNEYFANKDLIRLAQMPKLKKLFLYNKKNNKRGIEPAIAILERKGIDLFWLQ